MKRITIFLLLSLIMAGIALAVPIEKQPSTSQMTRADYVFRADGVDNFNFHIVGAATDSSGADSTGIFYAWKNMSFMFPIEGDADSSLLKIKFYGGYTGDVQKAPSEKDTLEFRSTLMDSLSITAPGIKIYTPSVNMDVCKMIYFTVEGETGNGDTRISRPVVFRDRW